MIPRVVGRVDPSNPRSILRGLLEDVRTYAELVDQFR